MPPASPLERLAVLRRNAWKVLGRKISLWENILPILHMQCTVLENVLIRHCDADWIARHVTVRGMQHVRAAQERGRGVLHLTSHIGNWEMGARITAALGLPLTVVVVASSGNAWVEQRYHTRRSSAGLSLASVGLSAATQALKALQQKRHLAIVFDMPPVDKGLQVTWFGRSCRIARGPFWLAEKTGAAIVPTFCLRKRPGHFELVFEEPIFSENPDALQQAVACMEAYQRKHWHQWAMFEDLRNFEYAPARKETEALSA